MTAWAVALGRLSGWRRLAVSFVLGAAATLAMAPLHIVPALVVSFTSLVWLLAAAGRQRTAFALGWWFGFGYFVTGLYWMGSAFLVEADKFAWMLPFAVMGLPAILGFFTGAATAAARYLTRFGVGEVAALALAWTAFEWIRGHVFTGFPWNLTGYAWAGSDAVLQSAAYIGIYGLSLLTVAAAAAPATLRLRKEASAGSGRSWLPSALAVLCFAVLWGAGSLRLSGAPNGDVEGVRLRLVQAAIPQHLKWLPELRRSHLERQLQMTSEPGIEAVSHVIWPETATPFFVGRDAALRDMLGGAVRSGGLLITGAPRTTAQRETPFRVWNSVVAVDATGRLQASYDKFHLVPFGEYVPFRGILAKLGVERLAAGRGDFQSGPGPTTLRWPGLPPVSPLICYEVIFPGDVADRGNRPAWLLNLTNDGWFGRTAGPYQHFAAARTRAVEEGLALVRSANTGISAIVGPLGRVRASLGLGEAGTLDGALPKSLSGKTVYVRFGDWSLIALGLLMTLFSARFNRRRANAAV